MTKYDKYEALKTDLGARGVRVSAYSEINYGIQFEISKDGQTSKVRIYESKKKGITVDLSQIKYEELKNLFYTINNNEASLRIPIGKPTTYACDDLDNSMIGVDESGKGDYFGPLVIAGVHADKDTKIKLLTLGVMDSKVLSDKQIVYLAERIKALCHYTIVVVGNEKYNELYAKIDNLNKLLAWGHARVIENMLEKVECKYALSDQFGNEKLIQNALMKKGRTITLEQRTKAEQNVVVAASILARNEFVNQMHQLEQKYGLVLPKGASTATVNAAKAFVRAYTKERLKEVCKLHFKTTQKL